MSSKWVITAAHCITSDGPTHAHLGLHDLSDAKDTNRSEIWSSLTFFPSGRRFQCPSSVSDKQPDGVGKYLSSGEKLFIIIVHPDYNPSTFNNDIALLKFDVERDVERWTPACLPASSADYVGQTAKVYGGKISFIWRKTFH